MEDVLALYEKPLSEKEPVVCVDEKPVVLHADVRPPRPMRPGRIARRDCEYQRCGTANVFCGVEPKAGRHFTKATPNRSSPQFADYLLEIAASYPEADTIHLVMDNLSSHTRKAMVRKQLRMGKNIFFRNIKVRREFWVVSNDLDKFAKVEVSSSDRPYGMLNRQDGLQIWVRTWSEILNDCRTRLQLFEKELNYNADRDESLEFLQKTYAKILSGVSDTGSEPEISDDAAVTALIRLCPLP